MKNGMGMKIHTRLILVSEEAKALIGDLNGGDLLNKFSCPHKLHQEYIFFLCGMTV
jgi:hypothetical protein